ncbi:unnamed protein product [Brassica rapa subsp. narinosa]
MPRFVLEMFAGFEDISRCCEGDVFRAFFRMFRIALEALLRIFPYMQRIVVKTLRA